MDREAMTDPLRAAREDCGSVIELARRLVRVPSRGGIDPSGPVLECMSAWLGEHGWACRRLAGPDGVTVALACEVPCVPVFICTASPGIPDRPGPAQAPSPRPPT
jgi:hypothetical protein